jgi:phosphatidylserine/phosphatidylglycerophosphate/cardiolipin synthase-like enzyme
MAEHAGKCAILVVIFAALTRIACTPGPRADIAIKSASSANALAEAEIELVESAPIETTLDHPDLRNASVVWPEMIDRAKRTLDFSEFYASEADGAAATTSLLRPVIEAIERAVARGVRVRFLVDALFASEYGATLDRLRAAGVSVRILDAAARYGGVQHAKYFVVDGEESFVGSQNFDWRALAHIQEIGVRLRSIPLAGALLDVFETDWTLADAATPSSTRTRAHPPKASAKARTGEVVTLWADPKGWLPDEASWDLDGIIALIDRAQASVDVQVLLYSTQNRDKTAFPTLDEALRRAAARGVRVRLLVSHWGAREGRDARASIEAISKVPNVNVKVLTVPPWSGGEIPFARVAHAKYMVVDDRVAWIGTSNWEGDYFLKSRNVAVVAEGGDLAPRLRRVFDDGWSSAYATPLASYASPPAGVTRTSRDGARAGGAARPSDTDPGPR